MPSPFRVFRKHQKALLASAGLMAMISFVFLPIILERLSTQRVKDVPVVTTKQYGQIAESHLQQLIRQRGVVLGFLDRVKQDLARQVGPETPARQVVLPAADMAANIGVADEEAVVTTWLLAKRAQELGIVVSDKTVNEFIRTLTRGFVIPWQGKGSPKELRDLKVDQKEVHRIVASLRVGQAQFLEILRHELLSLQLQKMFMRSLAGTPPGQKWDYFQRWHRMATVEVLPVRVENFLDQVPDPDEAVLREFYEKHKNKLPVPNSPEPGFREPHKVVIEYLKADLKAEPDKFVDRAAVTDEEIKKYYEENKDRSYRELPETPAKKEAEPSKPGEAPKGAEPSKPAAEPSKPTQQPPKAGPEAQKPATEPSKPGQEPPKPPQEPAKPAAESSKPAAGDPGAKKPALHGTQQKGSETGPSKAPSGEKTSPSSDKSSDASRPVASPFRLVALQAKDEGKPGAAAAKPAETSAKPEATASQPAEKPAGPAEKPKEPAKDAKPADKAASPPAPPKYLPLEKVKDQIRDILAQQQAYVKVEKVITGVQDELGADYEKWLSYDAAKKSAAKEEGLEPPPRHDFADLAKKHKLSAHITKLVSAWEIGQYDIAASVVEGRTQFAQYAFQMLPEFKPMTSQDNFGNYYLFWKVQNEPERTPAYEDEGTPERVLHSWKLAQARTLAESEAARLAEETRQAKKTLAALFGARPGMLVAKSEPFSWMTFGMLRPEMVGRGQPRISEVKGVEAPGDAFMRVVFNLAPGGIGVAPNQPQTTFYVVQAVAFSPPQATLWERFRDGSDSPYVRGLAELDHQAAGQAWLEEIKASAGFKWEREPHRARRGEYSEE